MLVNQLFRSVSAFSAQRATYVAKGDNLVETKGSLQAVDGATVDNAQLFGGKKVVVFGLPGAYTPVCTNQHVPQFIEAAESLKEAGVDNICCVSVNDRFVMDAWGASLNVGDDVEMMADWDCSWSKSLDLTQDLTEAGLGIRTTRFSMLVEDGKVTMLNIEENPAKLQSSGPQPILDHLKGN
mmetsp:Transcript_10712/g.16046  ORF Transcript_10712/g.16046 Transcript_10712/m.16046 type:complete len:182 (-) Transcript_10712:26-571(-)|eukprot:CAMPEP_0201544036 /NCGR_PEP_ID=MMETSP0173_2-20130828/479_1 /ASSEMBLY_ACC=CAM_ASM_000268 /TAXON_ID=218659 /ORGANISM="Vexillifera sp., Strain DIVA3 564/2" /LENGTH=181 /DNA_ID=CAMNT_0047952019 /DNA_START=64 /DNA_END=609 /DNA_ORIENTATION=-